MKKVLSITLTSLLIIILIIGYIPINSVNVNAKFINDLGNSNDSDGRIITLDGTGEVLIDGTTYFEVPMGQGSVIDAQLNISVMDYTNNSHPLNPTVNVGLDNDIEWEFSGIGYGEMGYQEYFKGDTTKHTVSFTGQSGGNDQSTLIKLPRSSQINNADISLKGRFSQPDFTKYNYPTDTGFEKPRYVETADINNDSWPDAIITSDKLNTLAWYENDGKPKTSEWSQHIITDTLYNAWAVAVGDMDNDNDLDVIATGNDPSYKYGIYWYENINTTNNNQPGNGTSWNPHRIDNSTNFTYKPQSVRIADIDDDGDNDTIVGSFDSNNGGVYWFENKNGKGTSWKNHTIYYSPSKDCRVSDIFVGNINHFSPTLLDVAVALYGQNKVVWFENDGDPVNDSGNWKPHDIYNRQEPRCIEIADMDNDGQNDVVVGFYQYVYWFKSPNDVDTATSWTGNTRISWIWYVDDIEVGEINNDNYKDVVATSIQWSDMYFLRNLNSAGTSFSSYNIDWNFEGPLGVSLANIDNDANGLDIVITGYNNAEVRWYRNTGSSSNWDIYSIEDISLNGAHGVFSADIDHIGINDTVVTGSRGGDIIWLEAPADPLNVSQEWTTHVIENYLGSVGELFVGDIDGDGWNDVAVSSQYPTNKVVWYECPPNPEKTFKHWKMHIVDNNLYYAWGVHIADIDDDGDNDIVATGRYSDNVNWYRNNDILGPGSGNGSSWTRYYIDSSFDDPTGVWVEDMDGDLDLDVVVGSGRWSTGTGVVWFEAPPDPTSSWTKHTIDTATRYVYDVMTSDINHDGNPDVVCATYYDRILRWYEAPDDPTASNWIGHDIWSSSTNYLYAYNLWVDDIGNDGYEDVVVGVEGWNAIWWFEAPDEPEKAGLWQRYTVDANMGSPRGTFIDDINQDGIKDIIATSYGGNLVKWYKVDIAYPEDVTLKIGETTIFTKTGTLNLNVQDSTDFAAAVNSYLASHQDSPDTDDYGNEFIDLRITTQTTTPGRITVQDLDIYYDYTSTIRLKPDSNLAAELTDLIPRGKNGTHRIYIAFTSENPCKVRFSDLLLEYNAVPEVSSIPERHINEDSFNNYLYDLREFFTDDYQEPHQLSYRIKNWTNNEYVNMRIYKGYYLSVNCTKNPNTNWHGTSEVVVYAEDYSHNEVIATYSKPITIHILPMDDPPTIKNKIQNIVVLMNTTNDIIDLDRTKKPYFTDMDSGKLYYTFDFESIFNNNISLNLTTENVLEITAVGGPVKNITVTVYCDDEPIKVSNFDDLEIFQKFDVEVTEIIDQSELNKPRWKTLPTCILEEDYPGKNDWIHLPNYIDDYDDNTELLDYSIISLSNNGFLEVIIDNTNNIDIIPFSNFDGTSEALIKATDSDGNYGLAQFRIEMIPIDDPPEIEFISPSPSEVVKGKVTISGYAEDIEGLPVTVQMKLGENTPSKPWSDIPNQDGQWSYVLDTSNYTERIDEMLTVRAFDGVLYSKNVTLSLIIDNTLKDTDGDGWQDNVDTFMYDPKEWRDSDNDGVGNNEDPFDDDVTQWSDLDGDGYGDNPTGKGYDMFTYDPTQQKDRDNDGYGDNPDGNNPDYYPYDSEFHDKDSKDAGESEGLMYEISSNEFFPYWIFMIILIVINIYVFTFLYMARTGKLAKRRAAKEEKVRAKEILRKEKQDLKEQKKQESSLSADAKDTSALEKQKRSTPMRVPIVYYPTGADTVESDSTPPPGFMIASTDDKTSTARGKKAKKIKKSSEKEVPPLMPIQSYPPSGIRSPPMPMPFPPPKFGPSSMLPPIQQGPQTHGPQMQQIPPGPMRPSPRGNINSVKEKKKNA